MSYGQLRLEGDGICNVCHELKTGIMRGLVGGCGFGSVLREGIIACCINPKCSEGQKNLAEQQAK